ncbi:MAG: tetratricopeptide repeat protein, partial [Bacteroidota bacterium]
MPISSLRLLVVFFLLAGGTLPSAAQKPAAPAKGESASKDSAAEATGPDAAVLDAAERGDTAALAAALAAGGATTATDANGGSALLRAAFGGHLDVARVLVNGGAVADEPRGFLWLDEATGFYLSGPLHAAVMGGHEAVARYLIAEAEADVDALSWDPHQDALRGWTPLQWAVAAGQVGMVGLLLDAGASPSAAAPNTAPPLAMALQSGQAFAIAALRGAGADAEAAQAYLPVALAPDATQTAALTVHHPLNDAGAHYATFTLDMTSPTPFSLAVGTGNFDPLVLVVAPSQAVFSNDDWLGQRDTARVVVDRSEAGTWQVSVWSYEPETTGAFEMTHRTLAPAAVAALQAQRTASAQADSLDALAQAEDDAGDAAAALALAARAVEAREAALGTPHPLLATHLNNLALRHALLGRHAEADTLYRRALRMTEATLGPEHPDVAVTLTNHAILLQERGRYTEAADHFRRALGIVEADLPEQPAPEALRELAQMLNNTAVALVEVGRLGEAETLHARALDLRQAEAEAHPDDSEAQQDVANTLSNLAGLRQAQGRYVEGRSLAEWAVAVMEATLGPDDPALGASLNNLAAAHATLADYTRAEALHRRALALHRNVPADRALSLSNLAGVLDAAGRTAEAEPLYREALVTAEAALGPEHPATLITLNNLAAFLRGQGAFAEAERRYRDALTRFEAAYDGPHPNVATARGNLGALLLATGRLAEAESLHVAALATYEAALGPGHPDVAVGETNLASALEATGRFAEAEQRYVRALALRRAAFGDAHPSVAESQSNLAASYAQQGRFAEVEARYLQAIATMEAALGPAHPEVATMLGNLAAFYQSQGRYAEAEVRFERARSLTEAALGAAHPDAATALGNLGVLYATQGRFDEAQPLAERVLALRETALGPAHPDVALALSNLGALAAVRQQPGEAAAYERRALTLRETALGPAHPDVATSLGNLAVYLGSLGDHAEAETLLRRALTIVEATYGGDHPDIALVSENLAATLLDLGRYREARTLLDEALALRERALSPTHPLVALTLASLADVDIVEGHLADATERYRRAIAIEQAVIDDLMPYATEREQRAFLRLRLPVGLPLTTALLPGDEAQPERTEAAFAHVLQRKALRLDLQAARLRAVRATADAGADEDGAMETVRLLSDLQAVSQRIAQATFAGPGVRPPVAYRARLDTLHARRTVLEDRLARASAGTLARSAPVDVASLAAMLEPGERLVEYVRFRPYDYAALVDSALWRSPRYVAFVVDGDAGSAGTPVRLMDLGAASEIDSLVARYRTQVVAPQRMGLSRQRRARRALEATAEALHARLVAPLALDGATALRIAPDGALHTLPFEALRDPAGAFLTDAVRVSYLTSGRTLQRPSASTERTAPSRSDALVVFAAVDYDAPPDRQDEPYRDGVASGERLAAGSGATVGVKARTQLGGSFAALPGTAAEAAMLDALGGPTRSFLGAAATEARLLALAAPRRLHIATHGFFLDAQATAALAGSRSGTLSGTLSSRR